LDRWKAAVSLDTTNLNGSASFAAEIGKRKKAKVVRNSAVGLAGKSVLFKSGYQLV
jgi:hypothetical protein